MLDIRFHGFNMERVLRGPEGELVPFGGNPDTSETEPVTLDGDQKRRARLLRQAINFAIDRDYLCNVILEGRAVPAKGVIPPGMEAFDPSLPGYRYDPEKAKALLAEAGYPGGEGLPPIQYNFNYQPPNPVVAQAIQGMLLKFGVRTELRQMDWGAYQTYLDEGKATFFRLAWIADYPDPENFLFVLFHSSNKGQEGNNARYVDPANDRRLEEARGTVDPELRKRRWRAVEAAIVEEAPWVFLYHNATALVVKPYVRDLVLTAMDSGAELQQVDLTKVHIDPAGD
jgi:peptide/nickel transport system substrate-binding protein/oligopeptide transport system substrate-binding protein